MVRAIVWLLASLVAISFLRGVIGIIFKALGQLFQAEQPVSRAANPMPNTSGMGGELVKDPVCGVFVSPAVALKKSLRGEDHFFCSTDCRDKYT